MRDLKVSNQPAASRDGRIFSTLPPLSSHPPIRIMVLDQDKLAKLQAASRIGESHSTLTQHRPAGGGGGGSMYELRQGKERNSNHLLSSILHQLILSLYFHPKRSTNHISINAQPGGKGTPRRKAVRKPKGAAVGGDDKKLQTALKKLNVQPVTGVEEVNMFREDGNVLHFNRASGESSEEGGFGFR